MSSGDHPLPTNSNSSDLNLIIMTRFRPIAPKPPIPEDPNLRLLPDPNPKSTKGKCLPGGVVRRRRGRRADSRCHHASEGASYKRLEDHETGVPGLDAVRTLQLKVTDCESSGSVKAGGGEHPHHHFLLPTSYSSGDGGGRSGLLVERGLAEAEGEGTGPSHPPPRPAIPLHDPDNAAFPSFSSNPVVRGRVLDVCLIVESVSKDPGCIEVAGHLLGQTDEERLRGLAADECPGFVSDVDKRVRWVNGAFERMMFSRGGGGRGGVRMMGEEDWSVEAAYFTSRVRIEYRWREERCGVWWGPRVVTVAPCDAWRMCWGGGGFAWRLDVNSALSLGR